MAEPNPLETAIRDPLSEVTRRERRFLLATSFIGITMAKTGLVPQKISALGVEFSSVNQKTLLYLIAVIVGYFFCAFFIYAASDFIAWRLSYRAEWKDLYRRRKIGDKAKSSESEEAMNDHFWGGYILYFLSRPVSVVRAIFEFILPLMVGLYAISSLVKYKVS